MRIPDTMTDAEVNLQNAKQRAASKLRLLLIVVWRCNEAACAHRMAVGKKGLVRFDHLDSTQGAHNDCRLEMT